MKKFCAVVGIIGALLLSACASTPEEPPTAAELYAEADELTNRADYDAAGEKYGELISTYPTSVYSQQALVDQIYSNYRRQEYAKAIDSANQFLSSYPDHPRAAYAMYMKGVVYFRENRGFLDYIGQQDPSDRAPRLKRQSFEIFRDLAERYPDSKYAGDAITRMRYLINSLARGELKVAGYYYERGAYLAAVNRVQHMLTEYPDSSSLREALLLLADAYDQLLLCAAAADSRRLAEENFGVGAADNAPPKNCAEGLELEG